MNETTVGLEEISAIRKVGYLPSIMTGVLKQLMIVLWSNPDNIIDKNMKDYMWDVDPTKSRVIIDPIYRWDAQVVQQRPAMMIKRNQVKVRHLGIDNRIAGRKPITEEPLNNTKHSVILEGSHTVFCIGGTGEEAEKVAAEVFFDFLEFASNIRSDLCLKYFRPMSIEPVSKLEESKEHFVVPTVFSWAASHNWKLTHVAPWLKGVLTDFGITE